MALHVMTSDCAALQGGVVVTAPVRVVGSTLKVSAAPPTCSSLHNRRLRQSGEDFSCRSRIALALLGFSANLTSSCVCHLAQPRPASPYLALPLTTMKVSVDGGVTGIKVGVVDGGSKDQPSVAN